MENTVQMIPIDKLQPFENHPFKLRDGEEKDRLRDSIQSQGQIEPLIVRPFSGSQYEIISGHRRLEICRELGITEIPAIVKNIRREEAVIMMVDSNIHRETLLPSEKAFAYKMKLEAQKQIENNGARVGHLKSRDIVALNSDDSREQIRRYIRLTYLIPELLAFVDDRKIAFTPAVELSYLTPEEQTVLLDAMVMNDCTPSYSQAVRLKKASQDYCLTADGIHVILAEPKANQVEHIRFTREDFKQYFPSRCSDEQMKKDILKGLELLKRQRERNRDAR